MITSNTKIKGLFAIFFFFRQAACIYTTHNRKKLKPLILTLEANSVTHF